MSGESSQKLATMSAQEMELRVDMAKFPRDLTPQEKALVIQVAVSYGLDPLMGELTVYQGRPFVTIDGRYRKAHESGDLDGVESRPATKQEREAWEIPEGDYFFRAEVRKKGCGYPFVGWGHVKAHELTDMSKRNPGSLASPVVAENPQRMAEKRAEAQALRKAFYLPLPSAEASGEEEPLPPAGPVLDAQVKPSAPKAEAATMTAGATSTVVWPAPAPETKVKRMTPLMPSEPPQGDDFQYDTPEEELFPPASQVPEVGLRATLGELVTKGAKGSEATMRSFYRFYTKKQVDNLAAVPAEELPGLIEQAKKNMAQREAQAAQKAKPTVRPQAKGE